MPWLSGVVRPWCGPNFTLFGGISVTFVKELQRWQRRSMKKMTGYTIRQHLPKNQQKFPCHHLLHPKQDILLESTRSLWIPTFTLRRGKCGIFARTELLVRIILLLIVVIVHFVYVISFGYFCGYFIRLCWYIFLCTLIKYSLKGE